MKETTRIWLVLLVALAGMLLATVFKDVLEKNDFIFWAVCILIIFLLFVFSDVKKIWRK